MNSRNGPWLLLAAGLAVTAPAIAEDRPLTRSERERARDEAAARSALSEAERKRDSALALQALYERATVMEQEGKPGDAIRVHRYAAHAGSGRAALRLGEIYDRGLFGVQRNFAESLLWYARAHELGEKIPFIEVKEPEKRKMADVARQRAEAEAIRQTAIIRQREAAAVKARDDARKAVEDIRRKRALESPEYTSPE